MPALKKAQSWKSSQTDYKLEQYAVYVAMLIKQESLEIAAALEDFHTQHIAFPFISTTSSNIWQCSHITELSIMYLLKGETQVWSLVSLGSVNDRGKTLWTTDIQPIRTRRGTVHVNSCSSSYSSVAILRCLGLYMYMYAHQFRMCSIYQWPLCTALVITTYFLLCMDGSYAQIHNLFYACFDKWKPRIKWLVRMNKRPKKQQQHRLPKAFAQY